MMLRLVVFLSCFPVFSCRIDICVSSVLCVFLFCDVAHSRFGVADLKIQIFREKKYFTEFHKGIRWSISKLSLPGITIRFDPVNCHKLIAVTSSREEVMHRKCRLANLSDTFAPSTSRRLDELEGCMADNPFPALPHMYWENVIHFHIISKLEDSKLVGILV